MIISASRRTDIPAFHSTWFMNRIRDGYVIVRNPYNFEQVTKLRLSPDVVDMIVFWTKNPKPLMMHLDELDEAGFLYYFQFTLTAYHDDLEPNLLDKRELLETMKELSRKISPKRVIWRYDPIVLSPKYTMDYHVRAFAKMCEELDGYVERCTISFLDSYYKRVRMSDALRFSMHEPTFEQQRELSESFVEIARQHNIKIETCAEQIELEDIGVEHASCVSKELIEEISGKSILESSETRKKSQREHCACLNSFDIGAYNTCMHDCKYCYANYSREQIKDNCKNSDKNSALLVGTIDEAIADIPFSENQKTFFEKKFWGDNENGLFE